MHFCDEAARVYSRRSRPRKTSLNWFIPAFVNNSVGSSTGTSDELWTIRCPFFSKNLRKVARISLEVIFMILQGKQASAGWPESPLFARVLLSRSQRLHD